MPQIKIERIISFTSEDSAYPASNILSKDPSTKWKCKTAGERSASLVLQLDQPYIINAIDIGNENSAYIEVLVSRSSSSEDFKVLLVMSSFMTPSEARQTQNVNKVRMFKQDELSEPERNEKWDQVKVVCTQPFNRHTQYGLSFINLYSSDAKGTDTPQQARIGKFLIRPESPDNLSIGSLFARRKQSQETPETLKGAAAIREATALAHTGSPAVKQKAKFNLFTTPNTQSSRRRSSNEEESTSTPKKRQERNRNELLYSKDEEDKHDKIDKLIEKKAEEKAENTRKHNQEKQSRMQKDDEKKKDKVEPKNQPASRASTPGESKTKNKLQDTLSKEAIKRKQSKDLERERKKIKKELTGKPFNRLLEDVVLVISGIQNPDRASLRTMALSMGAKYKADWDSMCTHLICAFINTPKFNQVKGKGKIVKRKWLEDCYSERKKLPWRRYALDKTDQGPESEDEINEKNDSSEIMEGYAKNADSDEETKAQGSDTDEKIEEIRRKQKCSKSEDDIFNMDTDSDSVDYNKYKNWEIERKLENFFEDKVFYVDDNFDDEIEKKLKQYIVAYNGILVENLETTIDIIVTNGNNYKVFKDIYPAATCIAPDWIWECHNCQKLTPMTDFVYE